MSFIIDHLEYLLQRHDCVTLPRIGALMVRHRAAAFSAADSSTLLPPSRELAFNGAMIESDGLLEASVARKCGVSFEAARRMVDQEIEGIDRQLRHLGEITLGRLGLLQTTEYGSVVFTPAEVPGWDCRYYGLPVLQLTPADSVRKTAAVLPYSPEAETEEEAPARGKVARSIAGIAASLAVLVTLALFLLNPIRVEDAPREASIAPTKITVAQPEPLKVPAEETESVDKVVTDNIETAAQKETAVSLQNEANTEPTSGKLNETAAVNSTRFNVSDPYCVIVASFPDENQAERYIKENSGRRLGVLEKDGRFRIYAATGVTYEQAVAQKNIAGGGDSWICRR